MDSRIVFEDKNATAYQWGKYELGLGRHYIWDRANIASRNKYMWETYGVNYITKPTYIWDYFTVAQNTAYPSWEKSQVPPAYDYAWNFYDIIPAGRITYRWSKSQIRYVWDKYNINKVQHYNEQYTIGQTYTTLPITFNEFEGDYDGDSNSAGIATLQSAALSNFVKIATAEWDSSVTSSPSGGGKRYYIIPFQHYKGQLSFDTQTGIMGFVDSEGNPTSGSTTDYPRACHGYILDADFSQASVGQRVIGGWYDFIGDDEVSFYPSDKSKINHDIDKSDCPITSVTRLPGYYTLFLTTYQSIYGGTDQKKMMNFIMVKESATTVGIYVNGINNYGVTYSKTPTGEIDTVKGSFIENVYSDNSGAYPKDDYVDDYWYVYQGSSPGEYVEELVTEEASAYPQNGVQGDYYYVYLGQDVARTDSKGDYQGRVVSANRNEYPDNGVQGLYWWQYTGTAYKRQYYTVGRYIAPAGNGGTETLYFSNIKPDIDRETGVYSFNPGNVRTVIYRDLDDAEIASLVQSGYKYGMYGAYSGRYSYFELLPTTKKTSGGNTFTELVDYSSTFSAGAIMEYGNYIGPKSQNDQYFQDLDDPMKSDTKGEFRGQVSSDSQNTYPQDGKQGNFWYVFNRQVGEESLDKGEFQGVVSSYQLNTYPQNGSVNGVWYVYKNYEIEYYEGEKVGESVDVKRDAYPDDGIQNGFWYKYRTHSDSQYAGAFIDFVTYPSRDGFPDNGAQGGYWYIYISPVGADIYTITSSDMTKQVTYKQNTNSQEDYVIGDAVSASAEFEILDRNKEAKKYLGLKFRYYTKMPGDDAWRLIGKFNTKEIERPEEFRAKLIGYDDISKFDIYVDDWIESSAWPMSLKDMFSSLCNYCGAAFLSSDFVNNDFIVKDNFTGVNVTGRQILGYIAQAAGGFACADANGLITVRQYTETGIALDKTKYVKATVADYKTPPINKLTVQMNETDLGVSSGKGDSVYKITNNPLFYADDSSEIQTAVNTIFAALKNVTYTPAEISLLQDFGINCGDIITVNGEKVYVMNKTINSSGVELSCTGSETREATGEEVNSEIVALRGKTNELTRDLEKTQSALTDAAAELRSEITQTASEIKAEIQYQGETITQIQANLDGIKLSYNSANGTASITIGDMTVSNLVDDKYVQQVVAGIDITGYVRFNDLERTGSTIINGSNITTGTIDADRINLSGAITWGDLSSECKNKIVEFAGDAGGAAVNIPSYIHATYIDQTNIYSPNIYGAKITAGTTSDGYIQMASNGLSFKSNTGGSLIGMGYYPGNYNLPYILLGAGVDSYGTDRGMIKKYTNGIWIGDSDGIQNSSVGRGTGLFVNFNQGKVYKYINGTPTAL